MEISSAQMQQAAAPSDSAAAAAAAADGGAAPERSRVARLMEVVSLAGGTAEHLCEALMRVGPDAEDLMVLRAALKIASSTPAATGVASTAAFAVRREEDSEMAPPLTVPGPDTPPAPPPLPTTARAAAPALATRSRRAVSRLRPAAPAPSHSRAAAPPPPPLQAAEHPSAPAVTRRRRAASQSRLVAAAPRHSHTPVPPRQSTVPQPASPAMTRQRRGASHPQPAAPPPTHTPAPPPLPVAGRSTAPAVTTRQRRAASQPRAAATPHPGHNAASPRTAGGRATPAVTRTRRARSHPQPVAPVTTCGTTAAPATARHRRAVSRVTRATAPPASTPASHPQAAAAAPAGVIGAAPLESPPAALAGTGSQPLCNICCREPLPPERRYKYCLRCDKEGVNLRRDTGRACGLPHLREAYQQLGSAAAVEDVVKLAKAGGLRPRRGSAPSAAARGGAEGAPKRRRLTEGLPGGPDEKRRKAAGGSATAAAVGAKTASAIAAPSSTRAVRASARRGAADSVAADGAGQPHRGRRASMPAAGAVAPAAVAETAAMHAGGRAAAEAGHRSPAEPAKRARSARAASAPRQAAPARLARSLGATPARHTRSKSVGQPAAFADPSASDRVNFPRWSIQWGQQEQSQDRVDGAPPTCRVCYQPNPRAVYLARRYCPKCERLQNKLRRIGVHRAVDLMRELVPQHGPGISEADLFELAVKAASQRQDRSEPAETHASGARRANSVGAAAAGPPRQPLQSGRSPAKGRTSRRSGDARAGATSAARQVATGGVADSSAAAAPRVRSPCGICTWHPVASGRVYCLECDRMRMRLSGPGVVAALRAVYAELGQQAPREAVAERVHEKMRAADAEGPVVASPAAARAAAPAAGGLPELWGADENGGRRSVEAAREPASAGGLAAAPEEPPAAAAPAEVEMDADPETEHTVAAHAADTAGAPPAAHAAAAAAAAEPEDDAEASSGACVVVENDGGGVGTARVLGRRGVLALPADVAQQSAWRATRKRGTLAGLHVRVMQAVDEQMFVYERDISGGMETGPIPAIIDDYAALRVWGTSPPPIYPEGFRYQNRPAKLCTTPAARQLLDEAYPASGPANMWAGCRKTYADGAVAAQLLDQQACSVKLRKRGRLVAFSSFTPLLECEAGCHCPLKSVTGRGAFLPLQLFLHQNPDGSPAPDGWGVRCAVNIAKGTFISVATGFVATRSETAAAARAGVPRAEKHIVPLDHFMRWAPALRGGSSCERPIPEELHRFPVIPSATLRRTDPAAPAFDSSAAVASVDALQDYVPWRFVADPVHPGAPPPGPPAAAQAPPPQAPPHTASEAPAAPAETEASDALLLTGRRVAQHGVQHGAQHGGAQAEQEGEGEEGCDSYDSVVWVPGLFRHGVSRGAAAVEQALRQPSASAAGPAPAAQEAGAGTHSATTARQQQPPPSQRHSGQAAYPSPSMPGPSSPTPFPAPAAVPGTAATAAAEAGPGAVVLVADEWARHPSNDVLQPNAAPISVDQTEACCWSPYRGHGAVPWPEDVPADVEHLVLDAQHMGNVSRFLTRTCAQAGNVAVQPVLLPGAGSALLYGAAFFASRDIPAMTELRWGCRD